MRWVAPQTVRFRLRGATYPYKAATSFRRLCYTLVMCYPSLLALQDPPEILTERTRSRSVWSLRTATDGTHLFRESVSHTPMDLGVVESLRHAQVLARRDTGRRQVLFAPHPLIRAVLPLWGSSELLSKRRFRVAVAGAHDAQALSELAARAEASARQSRVYAAALDQVEWNEIHNLPHSSSRQRLLCLRIKGSRLSGWDATTDRRGCPHCAAAGSAGGDTFHIVWACPAAQRLRRTVRAWWSNLGLWTTRDDATEREFITAVFSLRLPRTPPNVWELSSLSQRPSNDDAPEGPFPALQAAWQQIVLETFVVILGWRHSRFDPERAWSPIQAAVIHDASNLKRLSTLALRCEQDARLPPLHPRLLRELQARFDRVIPTFQTPSDSRQARVTHVLFFDGGSRGNPGPGGSGACVIRVDAATGTSTVVWSAAMSHANPFTTNNQAEYRGLITGLRAARHFAWPALEVAGDSNLIIRQLRDSVPPKNQRLLRIYADARRLADQVGVRRWTHQVRAYNKMADSLANHAMNQVASSQAVHPTARDGHNDIHVHLHNDIRPWLSDSVGSQVDFSFLS